MWMIILVMMVLFIINYECNGNATTFLLMAGSVIYVASQILNFKGFSV